MSVSDPAISGRISPHPYTLVAVRDTGLEWHSSVNSETEQYTVSFSLGLKRSRWAHGPMATLSLWG